MSTLKYLSLTLSSWALRPQRKNVEIPERKTLARRMEQSPPAPAQFFVQFASCRLYFADLENDELFFTFFTGEEFIIF